MPTEENFATNKKRRRSSLFVDRRSRMFEDTDVRESIKHEPAVNQNINEAEIQNYISNTKQCYKNWKNYEKKMKSNLEAARNAKPLQFDEKTLLEVLSVEDRSFLEEAESFLERRREFNKELSSVTTRLEALIGQYDFAKDLCDVTYGCFPRLHQATVVKAVDDHQEMTKQIFDQLLMSFDFPISNDAPTGTLVSCSE